MLQRARLLVGTAGDVQAQIMSVVAGVLTIVIGLVLAKTVIATAAAPGAGIGSFSGASSLNDLVPLVYYAVVVMIGVGMMGLGAAGITGKGPLK
tara:strand:+ start:690 stop:971 length:282 start_codon:yes stop_codon:yes gene_type:complete